MPAADQSPPSRFPAVDSSVEMILHLVGKRHEATRALAARHLNVSPEVLENPHEVRLAASVEAAHPNGRLLAPG